jgi:predicted RNase H-like HicB family nuclease
MKAAYPIVLSKGKTHIIVFVPDFNINTQGKDEADAMEMARDAIGITGIDMQDEGERLPKPSTLSAVKTESVSDVVTLVDVDFSEYRRKNDMRAVKKNCTIPSWLSFEAERAGVNFSATLQTALKRELNIPDRQQSNPRA